MRKVPQAWGEDKGMAEVRAGGQRGAPGLSKSASMGHKAGGGVGSRDGVNWSKTMSGEAYREKGFDASTRQGCYRRCCCLF